MEYSDDARLIQLPVSELKLGMYVAKLDKDWLDSSFLYQGFVIKTVDDIDALASECRTVWIDPQKAVSVDRPVLNVPISSPKTAPAKQVGATPSVVTTRHIQPLKRNVRKPSVIPKRKVDYTNSTSMVEEFAQSTGIFQKARLCTRQLFDGVAQGNQPDLQQAREIIDSCLDSILRNPSAMMWLTKIRNVSEYTVEHSLNVCVLSIAFGRTLGFTRKELCAVGLCGLLHDVGKMCIPAAVLDKAEKQTEKEWQQIKAHSTIGRKLLKKSNAADSCVDTAYQHHERIDGQGYPQGLSGDQISLYSKMVSLADSFDAMTARRCYSPPITPSAAIREIYKNRNGQFDGELALIFIKTIGLYPPGTVVELVNGYLGLVVERSDMFRHLPKILLLKDDKNNTIDKKIIDLALTEKKELAGECLIKKDHPNGYAGIQLEDYRNYIQDLDS